MGCMRGADKRMFAGGTSQSFTWEAALNITAGDELCVDYNDSVGYERPDRGAHVVSFLDLCRVHGVEKRPSALTLPPARVVVD